LITIKAINTTSMVEIKRSNLDLVSSENIGLPLFWVN
jgi:hypothetical protein